MASVAWMDHNERDRNMMTALIDLFRERNTIDELGLQPIWDALAELMFPGTSTVHTRARYFLLVPWIFQTAAKRKVPSAAAPGAVRRDEVRLIRSLIAGGTDQIGIIGRDAQASLKRMPSNIYWSGLARWEIRRFDGSPDQLMRAFDGWRERSRAIVSTDEHEVVESSVHLWDPSMPPPPDRFLDAPLRLELEPHEAIYLRDRIRDSAPGSLLDVVLDEGVPSDPVPFPWLHPAANRFPTDVRTVLDHARRYSEVMYGAQLLYNLLLVRAKGVAEWIAHFEERMQRWKAGMADHPRRLDGWGRDGFWSLVGAVRKIPIPATEFVDAWCNLLITDGPDIDTNPTAVALITDREHRLKGPLARIGNQAAIDRFGGAAGDGQYEFRWLSALRVVNDIEAGLSKVAPRDA